LNTGKPANPFFVESKSPISHFDPSGGKAIRLQSCLSRLALGGAATLSTIGWQVINARLALQTHEIW
jgi:hypothetical protein